MKNLLLTVFFLPLVLIGQEISYSVSEIVLPPSSKKYYTKTDMQPIQNAIIYSDSLIAFEIINYKINGFFREWYRNGQVKLEKSYKAGILDGYHKEWYENGQLKLQGYYDGGTLNGSFTEWDFNGEKRRENLFIDGLKVKNEKPEWKKLNLQFLLGVNSNYTNNTSEINYPIEYLGPINTNFIYGFNSKYIDVGWWSNKSSSSEDMLLYELSHSDELNGGFIDFNVSNIISPNKKINNYVFIRSSNSSYNGETESWVPVSQYGQVFINGVPQFDAFGNPVMDFQIVNQVVGENSRWEKKSLGIGYSLNKKYLNYEIILCRSTYNTKYQAIDWDISSLIYDDKTIKSYEVQVAISLKLSYLLQSILKL